MLQIDTLSKIPYYVQIYAYYRDEITARRMPAGMKMASVRELSQRAGVSKMTVEKAYYQLASEGYIIRRTKARYEVADIAFPQKKERLVYRQPEKQEIQPPVVYDFGSGDMDMERFPMMVWRKLMNRVLSEPAYLLANQDEQGAPVLRQALSEYVYQSRGVHTDPEAILIGSGTIPLLAVLASLLRPDYACIAVEEPGFRLGRELFRSRGFSLQPVPVRDGLLSMDTLERSGARLVYVSPSHQFPTGTVMPAGMRYDLLHWAGDHDGMIVEDDYDSELRYYGRPVPALQGMDKAGRVIYMGALSKVLPPFVRLSYMVLPPPLLGRYRQSRALFRQGASVLEQCVLAEYIRSGELARQVRRLRKDYQEKGEIMERFLVKAFGDRIRVSRIVSGVYCHITLKSPDTEDILLKKAAKKGCRVLSVQSFYENRNLETEKEFLLSFSKIPGCQLKDAVEALKTAWSEKEGD